MSKMRATRRHFLQASSLVAASTLLPIRALAAADAQTAPDQLAEDAFIWGVPLVLTARYLDIAAKAGVPFNQFVLSPDLASPKARALGPNVDTLYGLAWLDLAAAPQVLEVPDTHDRYYSIQLIDAYGNSFTYVGRRTTGTKAGAFAIVPPGFAGKIPAGVTRIDAPTGKILAFVRTLVRGTADLPAARAIHSSYTLGALADYPNGRRHSVVRAESINILPVVDLSTAGAGYFDDLNRLAAAYPPLPEDAAGLARFASVGVAPGQAISDPAARARLGAAVVPALQRVKKANYSTVANGWRTKFDVTNIIHDPLLRASTNIYGPGTHVAQEALYFSIALSADQKPLDGANRYRLRFPAGQTPPVDAFWSLTLYGKDFFLVDNPIDRYAITDRTDGLQFAPDGALEILIQHEQPAKGSANWLPAPAAPFQLVLRTYQPRRQILDRSYQLPAIEIVQDI